MLGSRDRVLQPEPPVPPGLLTTRIEDVAGVRRLLPSADLRPLDRSPPRTLL